MSDDTNGQPRYGVNRLTKRRILGLYGVMCGDGTLPLFTTWRFYRALLVRSLLENAYADGHFVGAREFPLPELERLRLEIERYDSAIASRDLQIEQLRPALKVAQQALLELNHAQAVGPQWYTRGKDGMYQQVHTWLRKGLEATAILDELPGDAGGRSYSKAFVLELLGYLTGAIPELHGFESGKIIALLKEFEHRQEEPK